MAAKPSVFAVVSDPHISDHIWKYRTDVVGDSYYSWNQICANCAGSRVNLVVAGDIFDGAVSSSDAKAFRAGLDLMALAGLTVFYIRGQHDLEDRYPGWANALASDICKDVNNKTFEPAPGCVMMGFDYMNSTKTITAALANVPSAVQALVMHQLLLDKNNQTSHGPVLDPAAVPVGIKRVFLGDLHKAVEYNLYDKMFYYGGSTHIRSVNEPPTKSYMLVAVGSNGNIISVNRKQLKTRMIVECDIKDTAGVAAAQASLSMSVTWGNILSHFGWANRPADTDTVRKSVARPIIRYTYPETMDNPGNALRNAIDGSIHPVMLGEVKQDVTEAASSALELPTEITPEALELVLNRYSKPDTEDWKFLTDLLTKPTDDIVKGWNL